MKLKVNVIKVSYRFQLVILSALLCPGLVQAQEPLVRFYDGGRWLSAQRTTTKTARWDGADVELDSHALIWADERIPDSLLNEVENVRLVSRRLGLWRVQSRRPHEDGFALSERLQSRAHALGVRALFPDIRFPLEHHDISVPPNDPRLEGQWFFERIGLVDTWRLEDGNEDVDIVVVDNGCDESHLDLIDSRRPGRDARDDDDVPEWEDVPGGEHGTACAALAAATTDNELGVAGACPECTFRCVRLLGEGTTALSADVAAFDFALETNAAVVSNSWGFRDVITVPSALRTIIERTLEEGRGGRGAVVVFAVGNDNRRVQEFELQAIEGVIGVGASNFFDETTAFTNFGRAVDVVAPTGTLTADISGAPGENDGDYTNLFGGTSSSAPIVAGIAGLLLSANPELRSADILNVLHQTAEQSFYAAPGTDGHDDYYGYGVVRPLAALRLVAGMSEPDSRSADAGVVDAGVHDAGPDAGDARLEDASVDVMLDVFSADAATSVTYAARGGCGCSLGTQEPPGGVFSLLLLLVAVRFWKCS